ncbi:MAG TPA: hypothetical protein VK875_02800 [Euzebyales bacterium]|nr:hypothetical protein [Euzebyales bacterium]
MPEITDQIAESFVNQLARGAFEGVGPLSPAREAAEAALLREHGDPEAAISALVAGHTRLAGAGGFATGLGGFMALPVALPANVLGFYTLAARLVAAIAHLRGHDLTLPETRVAVLMALTGDQASQVLARAGVMVPAGTMTRVALRGLPVSAVAMVNKAIGFKLLIGTAERGLARLGRAVPLAGGIVGGAIDIAMLRSIARHARAEFPVRQAERTA